MFQRTTVCLCLNNPPRNNSLTHTVHRHTACKQHSQQERDAAKDLPERKMRQTMDMRAESAEKLEPWLSSCRAVEAPSRRCRGLCVWVLYAYCCESHSTQNMHSQHTNTYDAISNTNSQQMRQMLKRSCLKFYQHSQSPR